MLKDLLRGFLAYFNCERKEREREREIAITLQKMFLNYPLSPTYIHTYTDTDIHAHKKLNVWRHLRCYRICDDVQGWDEELVTDEGEGVEHVDDADDVEDDGAVLQLLLRKQVGWKERVVFGAKQENVKLVFLRCSFLHTAT